MALKVMADNNEIITASQDGAMYNTFANNSDYVIKGIGSELNVTRSTSSLTVTLQSGECVLCGRHVTCVGTTSLSLPANSNGYLVIRYDSTSPTYVSLAYVSGVLKENINGSGQYHDIALGQFTTNASGVSLYSDKRIIKSSVSANIYFGTTEPSADLGNDGDIYIQYEG